MSQRCRDNSRRECAVRTMLERQVVIDRKGVKAVKDMRPVQICVQGTDRDLGRGKVHL